MVRVTVTVRLRQYARNELCTQWAQSSSARSRVINLYSEAETWRTEAVSPHTYRRRRRDSTVELSRVDGVY